MIPLIPHLEMGISLFRPGLPPRLAQASTDSSFSLDTITQSFGIGFGEFLPNLLGAIAIFVIGIVVAYFVALAVKSLLKKTTIDDRIAATVTKRPASDVPVAKWVSDIVFWIIILFVVIASLEALQLTAVSEPLNGLLTTILNYLPRVAVAGVLLALAWAIATVVKTIVTRGLESFNLDDRLAENTGVDPRENAVQIHETLGNALYWFVFLLFLPLILNSLQLNGLLEPVQGLIDQFLTAIPKILLAGLIAVGGWLLAKIVRGIVTNLLAASGVDNIGNRLGLSRSTTPGSGISISSLVGTVVYVAVLIPVAIAALEELDIRAISEPAVGMLNQILNFIPLLLAAGVVITLFYFIGQFVCDLLTNVLANVGFDNILDSLGLPDINPPAAPPTEVYPTETTGETLIQPPADHGKSPSEVVGLIALVGIVLFGVVTATEILQLEQLTLIVRAVMEIAAQVLVGVVIFAIGLYVANLVYRLIKSSSSTSSNTLAQAARIAILAFVGALALGQMGVATNIVNLAFGLLLGAVAVAIAIAFGLGGRDVAAEELRGWLKELKR